ncbi:MAG: hypothetical protein QGG40_06505, partial [Myxococcota bacterium]|nr:hypothetical protein [Myxococcota bacterium]
MTHALTLDSRLVAEDLYRFLCDLDPAQVRQQIEQELQLRAHRLRTELRRIHEGQDSALATETGPVFWERIREVAELFEQRLPRPDQSPSEMRTAWESFRQDALPAYERLAASLARLDIHVPSLRPTNYKRNLYHLANGVSVCLLIEWVLDLRGMLWVAGTF